MYEHATITFHFQPKETSYADLAGRFAHSLLRVNKYIFIMYNFDSNLIKAETIKESSSKKHRGHLEELT